MTESIFQRYYRSDPFVDRFARDPAGAIDVIIPVIHTNELWHQNLVSIYRDVPVNRLLISDGGCKDDSIKIVSQFPRVTVLDHHEYKSLGYCLRKLIEAVETDWFIYVHSDVYLPDGWFNAMRAHQPTYDWFGCPQRITVQVEYSNVDKLFDEVRPYAGSQMGRTAAFIDNIKKIDDDFVYRQEDYVMASMVPAERHGRIEDTFHYHQVMHKESPWARKIKRVAVQVEWSREEEVRASTMQLKGIVKYLVPSRNLVLEAELHAQRLIDLEAITMPELIDWIGKTNPVWLQHIKPWRLRMRKLRAELPAKAVQKLRGLFSS
ncbi:MAG TPA: glycosyltransferase family A protein [Kofleriaceae bacterium]